MNATIDCIPCFFHQILRTGRISTSDEDKIKRIFDEESVSSLFEDKDKKTRK